MAFRFKAEESVAKGIERMARGQIEKALEGLTGQNGAAPEEVVHDVRKRFKKVRALLRLRAAAWGGSSSTARMPVFETRPDPFPRSATPGSWSIPSTSSSRAAVAGTFLRRSVPSAWRCWTTSSRFPGTSSRKSKRSSRSRPSPRKPGAT